MLLEASRNLTCYTKGTEKKDKNNIHLLATSIYSHESLTQVLLSLCHAIMALGHHWGNFLPRTRLPVDCLGGRAQWHLFGLDPHAPMKEAYFG